jgi:hypothetical protein
MQTPQQESLMLGASEVDSPCRMADQMTPLDGPVDMIRPNLPPLTTTPRPDTAPLDTRHLVKEGPTTERAAIIHNQSQGMLGLLASKLRLRFMMTPSLAPVSPLLQIQVSWPEEWEL